MSLIRLVAALVRHVITLRSGDLEVPDDGTIPYRRQWVMLGSTWSLNLLGMADADGRTQHWGFGPVRSDAPELVVDVWVEPDGSLGSHLSGPLEVEKVEMLRDWLSAEQEGAAASDERVAFIVARIGPESFGLGKGAGNSPPEVRRALSDFISTAVEVLDRISGS